MNDWLPKSVLLLRNYNRRKFLSDLLAGVTICRYSPVTFYSVVFLL